MADPFSSWGSGSGPSGGGPFSNWGSAPHYSYGSPGSSHGGGGWLSGGGGFLGSIGGFIGNAGSDIAQTIQGLPSAGVHIGKAFVDQVENPGKYDHGAVYQTILKPFAHQESYQWAPLVEGHPGEFGHRFYQHPLGPVLDVLTVLSAGGGAALRGVKIADSAGRIAEGSRLARLARDERFAKYAPPDAEGVTVNLRPGKTLQGRAIQQAFDRWGERHPGAPIVGAEGRAVKAAAKAEYQNAVRLRAPVRQFQAAYRGLSRNEQFALHVAASGTPLDERLAYFRARLAERPSRVLQRYVTRLEQVDPKILSDPSPRFVRALDSARTLEQAGGDTLVQLGKLSRETREARRFLEQRIVGGATYDRAAGEFAGGPAITDLRAKETAGIPGRSAELGPAFRVPHMAPENHAGVFSTPRRALGKARPPVALKENQGLRFATGRLAANPEIFSVDYLRAMRYRHQLDFQKNVLDKVSRPLDPLVDGGKAADEWYYRPAGLNVPRSVREQDALAQDAALHAPPIQPDEVVFKAPPAEAQSVAHMNELGYRRVPARFAQRYKSEFGGVGPRERMFDRYMDVWRALVLKLRPAWLVNNVLGNSVLYGLRYAGPRGAVGFLRALKLEKGDEPLFRIANVVEVDKRMSSYGPLIEEVAPGVGQAAFFRNSFQVRHKGIYADIPESALARAVKTGTAPLRGVWAGVKGFGDAMAWLNVRTEDTLRRAAFLTEAEKNEAIRNIRRTAKELDGVNMTLKEALRKADPATVERLAQEVDRALGNFNDLSPFERRFIRKVAPFYSWYRGLIRVVAHSVIDEPLKWRFLQIMGQAASDDPTAAVQFPVPSWLKGAIPVGPEENGTQTVLSTQAVNPFATLTQIVPAVGSVAGIQHAPPSQGPISLLNPLAGGFLAGVGVDPTFGGSYHGWGSSHGGGPAAAGYLAESLPQSVLAEDLTGSRKSTLYPTQSWQDYLWNYAGIPVKRVNVAEAKNRARAGQ